VVTQRDVDAGRTLAEKFLIRWRGEADPKHVQAIDAYWSSAAEHGMNASTFTARVITSTGADVAAALSGAIGAMSGPLHGGAPSRVLGMIEEVERTGDAESYVKRLLDAGERLMGFGHRVYKVRDPRADVLALAAERLFTRAGDMALYTLAREVEGTALRLLEEYKPGRRLQTNVEFYTALLLHGLGLPVDLFTPTFAMGRVSGWIAHAIEQRRTGRLIRPASTYIGPTDRRWVPLAMRAGESAVAG
jgi:citrate synthase